MSIEHVKNNWASYRLLIKIMYITDNDKWEKIVHKYGDFPKNTPKRWEEWANNVERDLSIDETVEITQTALANATARLKDSHQIASAIQVDDPNEDTIESLIDDLNELNEVIKSDQNFHAALAIGSAVATEIRRRQNQA